MKRLAFLLAGLALAGCDQLTGAADQKIADAEAIGFACRVSQKQPEACMKENEAQSPSSILEGWRSADEDIKDGKLNPEMSNVASEKKAGEPGAEGEHKPEDAKAEEKPAEGAAKEGEKPAEEKKDAAKEADAAKKPADAAHDKPAH